MNEEDLKAMEKELKDMNEVLLRYTRRLVNADVSFYPPAKNTERLKANNPVMYKVLCEYLELEKEYQEKRKVYRETLKEKFECPKKDSPTAGI